MLYILVVIPPNFSDIKYFGQFLPQLLHFSLQVIDSSSLAAKTFISLES